MQGPDPLCHVSSVPEPTRRSTAEPAYAYGTEMPVVRVRDVAVGPRLPAVDPVRRRVRRFRQRYQQRPLFGPEHGPSGVIAFPERVGIVLVQPRADGDAQLVQRHEQTRASPRPTP